MIVCHIIAFVSGFILDVLFGDPKNLPHPVRAIGKLIDFLDKKLLGEIDEDKRDVKCEQRKGFYLCLIVIFASIFLTAAIIYLSYSFCAEAGIIVEAIMTYQLLAARDLATESYLVYEKLEDGDLPGARQAVSMIVGRDTDALDETGVAKAAIETVAENTSDGEIAPMLYLAIFGPIGGICYKAINTMDSMIGYKNDRYINFGYAAAKLDDFINYIPSRFSAILLIISAYILEGDFDWEAADRIWKRDRRNHASPNSAQTEAAVAGALNVQLAGDAYYFGKLVKKPTIGDDLRPVEAFDIVRANRLLFMASAICAIICTAVLLCFYFLFC